MCGLFGWDLDASKLKPYQRVNLATVLMMGNDERGGHSWGYWSPNWDKDRQPSRGLGDISSSVRAIKLVRENRLLAHTRFATQGDIKPGNAHPFVCGNVIGAHNGCLSNHWDLNKWYRKCEVDSEHIFWHLNDGEELTSIEAYGAIEFCYLDQMDKMYLAYFNGGDLSVAKTKAGVVWSSSEKTLDAALYQACLDYTVYKMEDDILYYVKDKALYETDYELNVGPYRSLTTWKDYKITHNYSAMSGSTSLTAYDDDEELLNEFLYEDRRLREEGTGNIER